MSLSGKTPVRIHNYSDSTTYKGPTLYGLRHGNGKQTFVDGSTYTGSFRNGLADGMGILTFVNGSEYCGQFAKGKFDGVGKFTLFNGDCLMGDFSDGRVHGRGNYTSKDQTTSIQGVFDDGNYVSEEDNPNLRDLVFKVTKDVTEQVEECKQSLQL